MYGPRAGAKAANAAGVTFYAVRPHVPDEDEGGQAGAQSSDRDPSDIHFEVAEGEPSRTGRNRWLLPLSVSIPARQLQFAPERAQNVAHVKILIVAGNGVVEVTNVTENDLRVVEGKNTAGGLVKYSVQILGDKRGSVVSIGVFDRRSGLLGVRTIDNRSKVR